MSAWLQIAGSPAPELERELTAGVQESSAAGKFSLQDQVNIAERKLGYQKQTLSVTKEQLELLRSLCQNWYVDFKPGDITSHRPIIGKMIVALKKCLLPMMRMLLKDVLAQQRTFNAQVIELATKLADDVAKLESQHSSSPKR